MGSGFWAFFVMMTAVLVAVAIFSLWHRRPRPPEWMEEGAHETPMATSRSVEEVRRLLEGEQRRLRRLSYEELKAYWEVEA